MTVPHNPTGSHCAYYNFYLHFFGCFILGHLQMFAPVSFFHTVLCFSLPVLHNKTTFISQVQLCLFTGFPSSPFVSSSHPYLFLLLLFTFLFPLISFPLLPPTLPCPFIFLVPPTATSSSACSLLEGVSGSSQVSVVQLVSAFGC